MTKGTAYCSAHHTTTTNTARAAALPNTSGMDGAPAEMAIARMGAWLCRSKVACTASRSQPHRHCWQAMRHRIKQRTPFPGAVEGLVEAVQEAE